MLLSRLTSLQREVLAAFFQRNTDFFLTGGAVLCGWELGHRTTDDLDLFTTSTEGMRTGDASLRAAAQDLAATIRVIQSSPDFRRYELLRQAEQLVVDLVVDRVPQLSAKVVKDGVTMDSLDEIFANKLCALVGRSEVRDLLDVRAIEATGRRAEDYLALAQRKDGGVTPATLAWLLSSLPVPAELAPYTRELERRMAELAQREADAIS